MTDQEILKMMNEGYKPEYFQKYRSVYLQLTGLQAPICGCAANKVFNDLKKHLKLK